MRKRPSPPALTKTPPLRAGILYQDRRITVTAADIRTASAYYPVQDTVGRLRRDPLWAALAFAGLCGFALTLYFDLWFWHERLAMGAAIILALIVGPQVSVLQLDARGFPPRLIIDRTRNVRAVFEAISEARAAAVMSSTLRGGGDVLLPEDDA